MESQKLTPPYVDLYQQHHGYVSDKWEHYPFIYEELIRPLLQGDRPVKLLEIGVQNGGSLEIWEKYLPKGSEIYGVDINALCQNLKFSEHVHFFCGDATKKEFIDQNFGGQKFDIILDDGSHVCRDVIETLSFLFESYLADGGLYIVEDLHASYWPQWGGMLEAKDSSIGFLTALVNSLHYDYYEKLYELPDAFRESMATLNRLIKRISFYDSICAIQKYQEPKMRPFAPTVTGEQSPVQPLIVTDAKRQATYELKDTVGKLFK
jgi:SAM-dependent methyltransferase